MKVLLIGGTGILSYDIMELCVSKNFETYILNRGNSNKEISDKVKVLIGDIRNKQQIINLISGYTFDVIIDFLTFNLEQLKQNLDIFNGKCDQYIFISSATAYSKTEVGEKISEKTKLYNPNWDYAYNKIKCEEYLKENYDITKQKYTIIRPYITYSRKRIPYAIIPHEQWTIANRIINNKPVLLGGDGNQITTLTQTKEFAVGVVGLFKNDMAYQEDFHITTDYTLTWNQATEYLGDALNVKNVNIAHIPIEYINKNLNEYIGTLNTDKGLPSREFNNDKIKKAVKNFNAKTDFKDGIKITINYYNDNPQMKKINYLWDGKIDRVIKNYYKKNTISFDKKTLSLKGYKYKLKLKDKLLYTIGNNIFLNSLYEVLIKFRHLFGKLWKRMLKQS